MHKINIAQYNAFSTQLLINPMKPQNTGSTYLLHNMRSVLTSTSSSFDKITIPKTKQKFKKSFHT